MLLKIIDELITNAKQPGESHNRAQLKALLGSSLAKLDLVPRAEFDTQVEKLKRAHQKIESLETQIANLEKTLSEQESTQR